MTNEEKEWRRILILCSIVWGKTPDEIEEKISSEAISLSDCMIVRNIVSLIPFFGESIQNYINQEDFVERESKIKQVNALRSQMMLLGKDCDPEVKEKIVKKVKELSMELNNG